MSSFKSKYTGEEIESLLDDVQNASVNTETEATDYLNTFEFKGRIYKAIDVTPNENGTSIVGELKSITIKGEKYTIIDVVANDNNTTSVGELDSITINGVKYNIATSNGFNVIITNYTDYPNAIDIEIGYSRADSYAENYITVQPDGTNQLNGITSFSINSSSCRFLINGAFIMYNNNNVSVVRGGNSTITTNGSFTIIPLSKIGITITDMTSN